MSPAETALVIDVERFTQIEQPMPFLLMVSDLAEVGEVRWRWGSAGLVVRTVRGQKMREFGGLFDEFAAAFQLPWYFGENVNAFEDCFSDLSDWISPQRGYVAVISHSGSVLRDLPKHVRPEARAWLVEALTSAAEEFAKPVELGLSSDRPPVPFHVVLHAEHADAEETAAWWRAAGATIEIFVVPKAPRKTP